MRCFLFLLANSIYSALFFIHREEESIAITFIDPMVNFLVGTQHHTLREIDLKDMEREPLRYCKGDGKGHLYKTFPDIGQGDH